MLGDVRPTDRVNPPMQRMQATRPDPVVDRVALVADRDELVSGYDGVLIAGQLPRLPGHPNPFFPPLIGRLLS